MKQHKKCPPCAKSLQVASSQLIFLSAYKKIKINKKQLISILKRSGSSRNM